MSKSDHNDDDNLIRFSDSDSRDSNSSGELYVPKGLTKTIQKSLQRADDILDSSRYLLRSKRVPDYSSKPSVGNTLDMAENTKVGGKVFSSVEQALRHIPVFDGTDSDESFRFFRACDFAFKLIDPAEVGTLVQGLIIKLSGKALRAVRFKEITTYAEFKKALGELTERKWTLAHLQTKLASCKKTREEQVQTYFERIEKLYHDIVDATLEKGEYSNADDVRKLLQAQVLTAFVDGLPETYRIILKSRNPGSLNEALVLALEEEMSFQSSRETKKMVSNHHEMGQQKSWRNYTNKSEKGDTKKSCFKCGRTNHIAKDCRAPSWDQSRYQAKPQQQYPKKDTQTSRSLVCRYCKKEGHQLEDCRKRQRANDKKEEGEKSVNGQYSGNEKAPDADGRRPISQIKTATLNLQGLSVSNLN